MSRPPGVDIEIRRSMWEFLREINARGTTIILTTHYLEEAETLCRNIAIINGGRIVERDRMSSLLRRLHTETFVLNLRDALTAAPHAAGLRHARWSTTTRSRSRCRRSRTSTTSSRGCRRSASRCCRMRNKVNRLEEIFMRLVEKRGAAAQRRRAGSAARAPAGATPMNAVAAAAAPAAATRAWCAGSASRPSSSASTGASSASGARRSCPRRSPRRCTSSSSAA